MYHCDKHVVKMPTEYAQLLFTAARYLGYPCEDGYKSTHERHPCSVWARKDRDNLAWLLRLARAVGDEYTFRYGKLHKATQALELLPKSLVDDLECRVQRPKHWAYAMPDEYKHHNIVLAYRSYYHGAKQHIAKWSKRGEPDWWHTGLLLQAA